MPGRISRLARGSRRARVSGLRQIDIDIINVILNEENSLGEAYRSPTDSESPLSFSPLDRINPPWMLGAQRAHTSMLPRLQTDFPHLDQPHLDHRPLPPSSCYSHEQELDHALSRLSLQTPSRESAIPGAFPSTPRSPATGNLGFTEEDFQNLRYCLESIQSPLYRSTNPHLEDAYAFDVGIYECSRIVSSPSDNLGGSFDSPLDDNSSYDSVAIHNHLNTPNLFRYVDPHVDLDQPNTYTTHIPQVSQNPSLSASPLSLPSPLVSYSSYDVNYDADYEMDYDIDYEMDRDLILHPPRVRTAYDSRVSDVDGVSLIGYPETDEDLFMDIDLSDDGDMALRPATPLPFYV